MVIQTTAGGRSECKESVRQFGRTNSCPHSEYESVRKIWANPKGSEVIISLPYYNSSYYLWERIVIPMKMNVATIEKIDVKICLVPYGTSVYREEISTVASQPQRNQQVKHIFSGAANLNNRFVPLE